MAQFLVPRDPSLPASGGKKNDFLTARAKAINDSLSGEMEVVVKVPAKRFMAQVVNNNLVIADSKTGLIEAVSEPYSGHGMTIREPGSFNRTFGGYGAIVEEAKKRLIIRAANGEHRTGTREVNAEEVESKRGPVKVIEERLQIGHQ